MNFFCQFKHNVRGLWYNFPMKVYLIIFFTCFTAWVHGQEVDDLEKPQFTAQDATNIARFLQQNKDIKTAVDLTRTAWQMTRSFASNEQLLSQWETAWETPSMPLSAFPTINSHLTAGQFLIQFSDGMNLDDWRLIDLPLIDAFQDNNKRTSASEYFKLYINLPYYWQQLMNNMNPEATWLRIPGYQAPESTQPKNNKATQLYLVLKAVQSDNDLATILTANPWQAPFDRTQVALLRAQYHGTEAQWLALFYDWLELYQLMESSTQLLTMDQQKQFKQVIDITRQLWQNNQAAIDLLDSRIHPLMLLLLDQIPEKFKNPDHFNAALNLLIFDVVWEMDQAADYAGHALRQDIKNNLEICLNLSATQTPNPQPAMGKKQFQSCVADFVNWGSQRATHSSLSGRLQDLDGALALSRALELPHFQIINFLATAATNTEDCKQNMPLQANPVEWTLATESLAWLHDRWPGLMAEWADKNSQMTLLSTGQAINHYPECINPATVLNNQYEQVKTHWLKLKAAITEQLNIYRDTHLANNSQIDFFQPVNQFTSLSAEGITIAPCDVALSCGAFVELPATTALLDLFPNHLKMAQQFGLGTLKLCYEEVSWQNRETEPTHLNNNSIANYTGQLSLQLTGQYNDEKVFTKVIQSDTRHLYLFGENTESVLDMACPLPIVGQQINTQLERGTFGLFPNRLTFLTAQRTNINAVISNNWTAGEQWQIKLADENHSQFLEFDEKATVKQQVNEAFLRHNNAVQQQIYRKLMYSNAARINDSALSLATFEYLTERQLLNKMTQAIFPQYYLQADVRAALKGQQRLMDEAFFKAAFESQSNLLEMLNKGDELLYRHKDLWPSLTPLPAPGNLTDSQQQLQQIIQFSP